MYKNIEERVCVKFCVSNEISCAKTLEMLKKTFGDSTMSKTQVYDWYKSFKEGREEVNDLPRSGRPSTSSTEENVDKIKQMVLENRHYSLREIALEMNMSHETARHILVDVLGMRKVAARLVPKDLNFLQKVNRLKVAEDMLERVNSDPTFIKRIITGDETWVFEYDMQTSQLPLRGTRFESIEDIKTNSQRELKAIPEYSFKKCFDDWIVRWKKCIAAEGAYFEGDIINLDD